MSCLSLESNVRHSSLRLAVSKEPVFWRPSYSKRSLKSLYEGKGQKQTSNTQTPGIQKFFESLLRFNNDTCENLGKLPAQPEGPSHT